jgi:hypothetical protein
MTLADLIAGGETLTVELKKDANDHDLVEAVVGLANAQGGVEGHRPALSGPQATRLLKRVAEKHPELHLEGARRGARYVWRGAKPSRGRK